MGEQGNETTEDQLILIIKKSTTTNTIKVNNTKVYKMPFARVYPLYIQKAEKKGRTKAEVDEIIFWRI